MAAAVAGVTAAADSVVVAAALVVHVAAAALQVTLALAVEAAAEVEAAATLARPHHRDMEAVAALAAVLTEPNQNATIAHAKDHDHGKARSGGLRHHWFQSNNDLTKLTTKTPGTLPTTIRCL